MLYKIGNNECEFVCLSNGFNALGLFMCMYMQTIIAFVSLCSASILLSVKIIEIFLWKNSF